MLICRLLNRKGYRQERMTRNETSRIFRLEINDLRQPRKHRAAAGAGRFCKVTEQVLVIVDFCLLRVDFDVFHPNRFLIQSVEFIRPLDKSQMKFNIAAFQFERFTD